MKNDNADALLDKMEKIARRIAIALGSMFIVSIGSAILVREWIIEQWKTSMVSFIGGMLAAALFGACVACCVLIPVLRSRINRLSDEIGKRPTQEQLDKALAEKDAQREAELNDQERSLNAVIDKEKEAKDKLQRRLDEELHWGDVRQFSSAELDLMVRIADEEDRSGSLLTPYVSNDYDLAAHLRDLSVTKSNASDKARCAWHLLPQWRKFVKRNRAEIDERTESLRNKRREEAEAKKRREDEARIKAATLPPPAAKVDRPGRFDRG